MIGGKKSLRNAGFFHKRGHMVHAPKHLGNLSFFKCVLCVHNISQLHILGRFVPKHILFMYSV